MTASFSSQIGYGDHCREFIGNADRLLLVLQSHYRCF